MDHDFHNSRLIRRAFWLIRLRWLAITATCVMTLLVDRTLNVGLSVVPIFGVAGLLVIENVLSLLSLRRTLTENGAPTLRAVRRNIHAQIAVDLLLLTVLLHYTGGVENPFVVYYVFHMAIAGSLLSVRESFLQATWAIVLLACLAASEFTGLVPHRCLEGFLSRGFHADGLYVLGMVVVLASMLFLVVYMTSDIAGKLRSQEQALAQANTVLEQKDRIKDEYVARVTHDIKGHLAAIESCHNVVIEELGEPLTRRQSDFIGRAHHRTQTLAKFVRTLLELTEMRLSNHLEMGVFSLREAILSVVASVEGKAREKEIAVTYTVDPQVNAIYGNFFSLEETIGNLVLNAVKYTPPRGSVDIRAYKTDAGVRVDVSDTGIGVPPEEMPQVFSEFFRASNARKAEKDGTGLGLSIAKQIVERHGGTIAVQGRPGGGSIFYFVLPENRIRKEVTVIADLPPKTTTQTKTEDVHT